MGYPTINRYFALTFKESRDEIIYKKQNAEHSLSLFFICISKGALMTMAEEIKKSLIKLEHWTRLHQEQLIE